MASYIYEGKEYTLSQKAEAIYRKTMGWDISDTDVGIYLYATYRKKQSENPNATFDEITTEDLDHAMYSELKLYESFRGENDYLPKSQI